jgi:hypothetical protein
MSVEDLNKIDFMGSLKMNQTLSVWLYQIIWLGVRTQMIICISYRKK